MYDERVTDVVNVLLSAVNGVTLVACTGFALKPVVGTASAAALRRPLAVVQAGLDHRGLAAVAALRLPLVERRDRLRG